MPNVYSPLAVSPVNLDTYFSYIYLHESYGHPANAKRQLSLLDQFWQVITLSVGTARMIPVG